ncbi:hypothetical protein BDN72DRAFT_875579 [Pluteus cervinus]|uniref:Uncharacterized protein n=1 Tax=Pluteus cervinus TaxID=181527 RepID=A0ACD3B844_9AGAR|nr:hypothetical protein BDN72DRAFT_875579 [Pluteus cervinus]
MDTQDPDQPFAARQDDDPSAPVGPSLPPEIVYEIFMMAYHKDRNRRTDLLVVSKLISQWLIPAVYKMVATGHAAEVNSPSLGVLQRYGHHVKHLLLSGSLHYPYQSNDGDLIQVCPNVSDLILWHGYNVTHSIKIFDLSLSRLSVHTFSTEFEDQIRSLQKTEEEKYRSWCSNITHMAWGVVSLTSPELLPSFPNLTHFLFGEWSIPHARLQEMLDKVLKNCPGLQVVVVLLGGVQSMSELSVLDSLDDMVFDDGRVVVVDGYFVTFWLKGGRGEDDMWTAAERTVRERGTLRGISMSP